MSLELVPKSIKEANRIVGRWHRHNRPVVGALFAIGVNVGDELRGVAIVGRPNGRMAQDGFTCEITRVATDGTYNACSKLYGSCCRAAKAMGYKVVLTKTLPGESGASLKAAGFEEIGLTDDQDWDRPSRRRVQVDLFGEETRPSGRKRRWRRVL